MQTDGPVISCQPGTQDPSFAFYFSSHVTAQTLNNNNTRQPKGIQQSPLSYSGFTLSREPQDNSRHQGCAQSAQTVTPIWLPTRIAPCLLHGAGCPPRRDGERLIQASKNTTITFTPSSNSWWPQQLLNWRPWGAGFKGKGAPFGLVVKAPE